MPLIISIHKSSILVNKMADQVLTPFNALDKLQEQLTCPVCLSQFDSPKTLPCLHSFCLKCIQQLPVELEKGKHMISCPTCRKTAQVPNKGPADLPTAFVINSLVEIEEQLTKLSIEGKQISCDNCSEGDATSYCKQCAIGFCEKCLAMHNGLKSNSKHQLIDMKDVVTTASQLLPDREDIVMNCTDHNEPLKVFCETCQELICLICTIRRHKDHNYDVVSDTFPKYRQDIEKVLEVVVKKMLAIEDAMTAITRREEDVTKQRDDRIKEIRLQVQGIVELVTQTGEQLEGEVTRVAKGKLQLLGRQKEEAELAVVQLKSCKEFVEKGLEVGSQQQILSEKKSMIEGMEVVSTQINPDVFQPVEEANITFTGNEKLVESCKNIGIVNYSFSAANVAGKFSVNFLPPMVGRKVTATLSLQTKLGSPYKIPPSLPLTCHLISGDTSQAIVCDIKETEVGKYFVSFTPSACGKHQLNIQVGGINIDGSPFSLDVVASPETRGKPVKIISRLNEPWGIAVDKKRQVIVAECNSHCITVYDKEGKKIQSFGSKGTKEGQFTGLYGVAATNEGYILATDRHRLQKLSLDGRCVMSVGSSKAGSGPLQFDNPVGIAVHPTTGQIYVAENWNHRIQVINGDFTYSHSIGSQGTAPGQLNRPWDVALDGVGNVYVVNDGIDVFTSDGKHLKRFGSRGSGDGQLGQPSSITIDTHNIVYVAENGNHRISVFTTDGVFIRHIGHRGSGEGEFNTPRGIAVNTSGNLCISDSGNSRVILL